MLRQQFYYHLPKHLIAQHPYQRREANRLLVVDAEGSVEHRQFPHLYKMLTANDLLVINTTKVMPARLHGHKETGAKVELLIERLQNEFLALAQVRANSKLQPGSRILLQDLTSIEVVRRCQSLFQLRAPIPWRDIMSSQGSVPLPPYIKRDSEARDKEAYQTVYAKEEGAVAAPTAGLHFDSHFRDSLQQVGVKIAEITLHIGAGTFQPVRSEQIEDHRIHKEWMSIDASACDLINRTRDSGGRVVAVGTTVVRALETVAQNGHVHPFKGDTGIYIYPGYQFQVTDAMITNFHLPESTLLMLVCAFSGYQTIMNVYQTAVQESYRFYSYGDAMFIVRRPEDAV